MKLGVLCYIENSDKEILMLHRVKKEKDQHEGKWVAPGGKVEYNESPLDAVKREVKEETGLDISNVLLRGIITFPENNISPFGDLWYVFVYYTKNFDGDIIDSDEGKLEWIPRKDLLSLPMWEGDKIFTPYVFDFQRTFDIILSYENTDLIGQDINLLDLL